MYIQYIIDDKYCLIIILCCDLYMFISYLKTSGRLDGNIASCRTALPGKCTCALFLSFYTMYKQISDLIFSHVPYLTSTQSHMYQYCCIFCLSY